ncbi:helix-turn-helix transcriptional regulator [Pseudoduganella sp. R-34]|uniref:helix-turn-helix transcriptional regulator n=1 Tax=unclassified Pseudoduganella TaxID=2637179 RepID=UPI003CF6876B
MKGRQRLSHEWNQQALIHAARTLQGAGRVLPFSVYSSVKEQKIVNVPIIRPMLICVLDGSKRLGSKGEIVCPRGSFIVLSNHPSINMRNIPGDGEYLALIVEFEHDDFDCLPPKAARTVPFVQGEIGPVFEKTLQQFVEWAAFAPQAIWAARRREILQLIYHLGHVQVSAVMEPPSLSHRLHSMICVEFGIEMGADVLASRLALSESTLRRKLAAEGTTLQAIKDRARLGHGLHLVQTTFEPIGRVAERCGYQSQSRFTDKFKQFFGITPSELRKTRMRDEDRALLRRLPTND